MFTQRITDSPQNVRGGQVSYLLLTKDQFGSRNLMITWVEGGPDSEQPLDAHPGHEQVYVIVQGRGLMMVGEEQQEVVAGTLVFIPSDTLHAIRNTGQEPLVYVSATAPPIDLLTLAPVFAYTQ